MSLLITDAGCERLAFRNFEFDLFANGLCRAEVELARHDQDFFVGECEGSGSATGSLRCAARASIQALQKAVGSALELELLGVKAVQAFDSTIVIVSVAIETAEGTRKFVGAFVADEGMERAAAIAVLNATNRFLGHGKIKRAN